MGPGSVGDLWFLAILTSAALVFIFGAFALWLGLRGQRLDDRPVCRGCGFDLSGLSSAVCPECGADLSRRGAVREGRRKRRVGLVVLGVVCVVVGLGGAGAVGWTSGANLDWNAKKPLWLLERQAVGANIPNDLVLRELMARRAVGTLGSGAYAKLAAHGLARQADPKLGWSAGWGDLIEDANQRGDITPQQHAAYLVEAVVVKVLVRERLRGGERMPLTLELDMGRAGTNTNIEVQARGTEILIAGSAGEELSFKSSGGGGMTFWGRGGKSSMGTTVEIGEVPVGKRAVRTRTTIDVLDGATRTHVGRRVVELAREVEFVGPDEPVVRMVPDPGLAEEVRAGLQELQITYEPAGGGLGYSSVMLNLRAANLPVNVSFMVKARRVGEDGAVQEWELPTLVLRKGSGGFGIGGMAPAGFPEGGTVDVVLTSDEGPASQTPDVVEAWEGEVVVERVPVVVKGVPGK